MNYRVCLLLLHATLAAGNPCSNQVLGSQPDPDDCHAYIVCWMSVPYLNICPDQQLYDVRTKSCQPSHLSICCNITFPTSPQRTLPPDTSDSASISTSSPILPPSPATIPSLPPIMTSSKSIKYDTLSSSMPSEVTSIKLSTVTPITSVTEIDSVTTEVPSKITDSGSTGLFTAVTPAISSQITESVTVQPTTVTSVTTTQPTRDEQSVTTELPSKVTDSVSKEIPNTTFYPTLPPITTIKQSTQATPETTATNKELIFPFTYFTAKPSISSTGSTITVPNTTEEVTILPESHITETEKFFSTTNKPFANAGMIIIYPLTTKMPLPPINLTTLTPTLATPEVITTEYTITNTESISTNFDTTSEPLTTSEPPKTSLVTTALEPIATTSETMSAAIIPTGYTQPTLEPTANTLSTLESISTSEMATVIDTSESHSSMKPFFTPITTTNTKFSLPTAAISTTAMYYTDESTIISKSPINDITTTKSELLTSPLPFTVTDLVTSQETTISAQPFESIITQTAPVTEVSDTTSNLNTITVPAHKSTLSLNIPTMTSTKFALRTNQSANPFPSITFTPTQSSNTETLTENYVGSTTTSPKTTLETEIKFTKLSTKSPIHTSTSTSPLKDFTEIIIKPTTLTTEQDTTLPTSISSMDSTHTTVESSTFNTEQDKFIIFTQETNKPTSTVTSTFSPILPDIITTTLAPKITFTTNTPPQSTTDNTATLTPISSSKTINPSTSESTISQTTVYLSTSNKPEVPTTIETTTEALSDALTHSATTANPSDIPFSTIIITPSTISSNITSTLSPSSPTEIILTTPDSTTSSAQFSPGSLPQTSPSSTLSSLPPSQPTFVAEETTKLPSSRPIPTLPPAPTTTYMPPCLTSLKPSTPPLSLPIPICRPVDEFVYPDFSSCSFYFECTYGVMKRMKCKYGYQFNPRALKCMPRIEANCRILTSPTLQIAFLEHFLQSTRRAA